MIYIERDISSLMVHLEAGSNYYYSSFKATSVKASASPSRNNMMVNLTSSHLDALLATSYVRQIPRCSIYRNIFGHPRRCFQNNLGDNTLCASTVLQNYQKGCRIISVNLDGWIRSDFRLIQVRIARRFSLKQFRDHYNRKKFKNKFFTKCYVKCY